MTPASYTICNLFCETDSKLTIKCFIQINSAQLNLNMKYLTLIILVICMTVWLRLKSVEPGIKACPSVRHDVTESLSANMG